MEVLFNSTKKQLDHTLKMKRLIHQSDVSPVGWHGQAFRDIEKRLSGKSRFPCVFSKNAFTKKLILFYFVETTESSSIENFSKALTEYVNISRMWDGTLATSFPLIVSFSRQVISANSVEEYQDFGWRFLQQLHEVDAVDWPKDIASDPNHKSWSMCFSGMPVFCNMSSPCHELRLSRNLGRHFKLIINPRERFDTFAGETISGRRARLNIRDRIDKYDLIPHSQQLSSYPAGGLEWLQYGLPDDNVKLKSTCPFTLKKKAPN